MDWASHPGPDTNQMCYCRQDCLSGPVIPHLSDEGVRLVNLHKTFGSELV